MARPDRARLRAVGGQMTTEVMLLNMQGAALAADSAVTVSIRDENGVWRPEFHQNGVEKIFVIDASLPVASMIFGNAGFYGYPWATIFEAFKASVPAPGTTLPAIAQSLVRYLVGWSSGADAKAQEHLPLPHARQLEINSLQLYVDLAVRRFYRCAERASRGEEIDANGLAAALEELRMETQYSGEYTRLQSRFLRKHPLEIRPRIGEASPRLAALLDQQLEPMLTQALSDVFESPVAEEIKVALAEVIIDSCLTDWLPPHMPCAGIVFAGYGAEDVRPAYIELSVGGAFGGLVKQRIVARGAPSQGEGVVVKSFAQTGLIEALLHGAQALYRAIIFEMTWRYCEALMAGIGAEVAKKDEALARSVMDTFVAAPENIARNLLIDAETWSSQEGKVSAVVSTLSPSRLAEQAVKLVRLSVIEHDLTGSRSVGEPITAVHMRKGAIERLG